MQFNMKKIIFLFLCFVFINTRAQVSVLPAKNGGTGLATYTIGDIIYASSPTTFIRLPIDVNGKVLTISGGLPIWQNPAISGSGTINYLPKFTASGTIGNSIAFDNGGSWLEVTGASVTGDLSATNGNDFRIFSEGTGTAGKGLYLKAHRDASGGGNDWPAVLKTINAAAGGAYPALSLQSEGGKVIIGETNTATLQYKDGNQASGKVLTSDAAGVGSWQTPATTNIQTYTAHSFTATETYTVSANTGMVVNTNTATIASATINFSTLGTTDGQLFSFTTAGAITTLSVTGATFYNATSTSSPASQWIYVSSLTAWVRKQ